MSGAGESPRAWAVGLVLALILCGVIGGVAALTQLAGSTTFSVVAQTDTLSLRPACADRVVWDLPPGTVRGARDATPAPARARDEQARPVTLAFAAGFAASVTLRADRRIQVSVRRRANGTGAITATVGKQDIPVTDDTGLDYVSAIPPAEVGRASGPPRWPLTLRLSGRVVIGDVIPEGGGWSASSVPILRGGQILAYGQAVQTGERLTLLSERIDPGTIVDTHPAMNRPMPDGTRVIDIQSGTFDCEPRADAGPSIGYVAEHRDGGLEVVLYRTAPAIGLAPLGGRSSDVGITRWDRYAHSPVLQIWAASLLLLSVFLQLWTTARDFVHLWGRRSR